MDTWGLEADLTSVVEIFVVEQLLSSYWCHDRFRGGMHRI